jgi:hypothetical protein
MRYQTSLRAAALGVAAILGLAACDNGLTGLNRNPNSPDQATPEFLFANATEAAISRVFGADLHMDVTGLWVQHLAEHRFSDEDRYIISDGKVSSHWTGFYSGPLEDFQEAITLADAANRPEAAAMGRIMKAWTFHVVTDLWGDIGYSEALQGRDPAGANQPAFDPQQSVYTALLAELEDAEADLDAGGVGLGGADLLYGGDTDRWSRFANSLRLRLAMRLSEVDATLARQEFNDALAAGVMTSNADNAVLHYIEGGTNAHPIYEYELNRDDHSVSKTLVDTLRALADPRLPIYAEPTAAGTYVGTVNAYETQPALTAISHIGDFFSKADAPAYVMTYAEVLFLQAEAAQRGWITADPAALYQAAIAASMQMLGVPAGDIAAYVAQPRVQYAGGDAGLTQIALQKWIALFSNGVEAYAEYRRTGQPVLMPGPNAENNGIIPVRLPYPSREASLNSENLESAKARQGGADLNDPVWWDQ